MSNSLKDVYDYYNDDRTIDNMLDPNFFGKNLWHTKLLMNYNFEVINENEFLIRCSELRDGDNIVDFGCGVGGFLKIIMNKYDCVASGINISPKQIEIARNSFKEDEKIEFMYFSHMKHIPSNSVDIVFAQESIVHYDNKRELFDRFNRILKNNGTLIFLDWFLFNEDLAAETDKEYKTFIEPLDSYKKLLKQSGFKSLEVHSPLATPELNRVKKEKGFINYIIKCKKHE
jgi:SAM-dependent methyltransferase